MTGWVDEYSRKMAGCPPEEYSLKNLYEAVQRAPHLIPRLYLLIMVGSVFIQKHPERALEVLFDLVNMCKGVQHPLRGLFLRNYLTQMSTGKLPEEEKESCDFLMKNFQDMVRLWVRIQHQGSLKDRDKRETERKALGMLIGTCLDRMSNLKYVTKEIYKTEVLEKLLKCIVESKDRIAQQCCSDWMIHVFSGDFHIATLEQLLGSLKNFEKNVNLTSIIIPLMKRIVRYINQECEEAEKIEYLSLDMFQTFRTELTAIVATNDNLELVHLIEIANALVDFARNLFPEKLEYINGTLGFALKALQKHSKGLKASPKVVKFITKMLIGTVQTNLLQVTTLDNYFQFQEYLTYSKRKELSISFLNALFAGHVVFTSFAPVGRVVDFCQTLLLDEDPEQKVFTEKQKAQIQLEQNLLGRLVGSIKCDTLVEQFDCLKKLRNVFFKGGEHRTVHNLPPLVFQALKIAHKVTVLKEEEKEVPVSPKKLFQFVHKTLVTKNAAGRTFADIDCELAFNLYLEIAISADRCGFEPISYEFFSQAFEIYEKQISLNSDLQFFYLTNIIGTLIECKTYSADEGAHFNGLARKTETQASELLKQDMKARALYKCAFLHWNDNEETRDPAQVMKCLRVSLKIANDLLDVSIKTQLFIEILDVCLVFLEERCPKISVEFCSKLVRLIKEHLIELNEENGESSSFVDGHTHFAAQLEKFATLKQDVSEPETE